LTLEDEEEEPEEEKKSLGKVYMITNEPRNYGYCYSQEVGKDSIFMGYACLFGFAGGYCFCCCAWGEKMAAAEQG